MLIVTRKAGTSIHIGEDVVVHVREIRGKEASIGIEAPRTTRIVRSELLEAIQRSKPDGEEG